MIAAIAIVAIIVVAVGAYVLLSRPSGTLNVIVTDAPAAGISHLYLTVSDITLQGDGNSSTSFKVTATQFDLLSLQNVTKLIGSNSISAGNYTMIRFTVVSAVATESGTNVTLTVPSGEVKVPIHFQVSGGKTTSITLDITADMTAISTSGNLRPVVTVKSVTGPS